MVTLKLFSPKNFLLFLFVWIFTELSNKRISRDFGQKPYWPRAQFKPHCSNCSQLYQRFRKTSARTDIAHDRLSIFQFHFAGRMARELKSQECTLFPIISEPGWLLRRLFRKLPSYVIECFFFLFNLWINLLILMIAGPCYIFLLTIKWKNRMAEQMMYF